MARFARRRGFSRGLRPIVNTIKNQVTVSSGTTGATASFTVAKAVTAPSPTVDSDVSHGCNIKAVWLAINGCGLGGTGVLNNMNFYLLKNPGNNLTPPAPISVGTSNEKKFVFRQWMFMIMRNQDGNTPFHWEGWVPIPKRYQRFGTDDILQLNVANTATLTGHFSFEAIYKWQR